VDGILNYKNRIVIGSDEELRKRLVNAFYDSYNGGHAWIQNFYKRLKALSYWSSMKQLMK